MKLEKIAKDFAKKTAKHMGEQMYEYQQIHSYPLELRYKFGDVIKFGVQKGVVISGIKKRKHTYYEIIWEELDYSCNDWDCNLVRYDTLREDELELIK